MWFVILLLLSQVFAINGVPTPLGLATSNAGATSYRVQIYNCTSANPVSQIQLKQSRTSIAAVTVLDFVIFAGGQSNLETGELSNAVDIYNALNQTWRVQNYNLSVARTSIAATSVGNLAFFAGGCTDLENNTWTNIVDIYSAANYSWTTRSLSSNVVAATSIRDLALFVGSFKMDIFNFSTQTWNSFDTPFNATGLALSSGDLSFFTGIGYLYIYNVTNKQWNNVQLPGPGLYVGTIVQNRLFLADADYNPSGKVYVFDFSAMAWLKSLSISAPRGGMAVATVHTASSYIALFAGGTDPNGQQTTAVDEYFYCFKTASYDQCPAPSPGFPLAAIILAVASFVIALLLLYIFIKYRRDKKRGGYYPLVNVHTNATELDDVQIQELIGAGQFSEVHKGIWKKFTPVAVKKLKMEGSLFEFGREVDILCTLNHPNCVRLYGTYEPQPGEKMMVLEYLPLGDVASLLRNGKYNFSELDLLKIAQHIINGMAYLADNHVLHRDLALRNVLIAQIEGKFIAKVSDFGLSRIESGGYYKTEDKTLAIKWAAIEAFQYGKFSTKSDVWSFGVCLWELFSVGKIPYTGMSNAEVAQQVADGYRLPCPENCPKHIYDIMLSCWNANPVSRPSFEKLGELFDKMLSRHDDQETLMADFDTVKQEPNILAVYN